MIYKPKLRVTTAHYEGKEVAKGSAIDYPVTTRGLFKISKLPTTSQVR